MSLIVFIPGIPPSINHQYAHSSARHWLTADACSWINAATAETLLAARAQQWQTPAMGEFAVFIEHTASRQDVDNCVKIVLDSVSKALGFNDRRVREIHIQRTTGPAGVTVIIQEVTP